jgi:hypothetical protein
MTSAKNLSPRCCRKCAIPLSEENWKSYDKKHSSYICIPCRKIKDKITYQNDPDYCKKQMARYRSRKSAVIHAYGDKCNQCGEDDYYKLTIDHINGGGNTHRKTITTNIYEYLYNNLVDYDRYQVLCYNCNCSKNVVYKDKYALRDKKKVMEAYGNCCVDCNEDRIERLTIDHSNNDGASQRRELKCHTGVRMYRWLIKNNFPIDLGLQILCYNCNCRKLSINDENYCLTGVRA